MQLWHGLLLVGLLAGFGVTAWRLHEANQIRLIDQELEHRVSMLASLLRLGGGGEPGGPPPRSPNPARGAGQAREGFRLSLGPREAALFEGSETNAFYYVVWARDGRELSRSATAPPEVVQPAPVAAPTAARFHGTLRECFHSTPPGDCILVGRDVRVELKELRRYARWLLGMGGVVLGVGLAGGWWVSSRSLRPIRDISAAATKIAAGDLSQRVQTGDAVSELGELAQVLNDTFGRLQASFERQARFTADASHELRTPVSVVLTQTQAALARERSAPEYRESLAACQRAAQRMRRLTISLLTLARLDSGEAAATRETCDLERIARDAIELLRPLAQEQNLTLEVESAPARCEGNAEQLGQVVTNLVSNAIAYNRPGGSVQVSITSEPEATVLTVSDTGQGIAPEDLPHIFERFYRADKARSSTAGRTGLGLAIAQAIVEAHGGNIQATSEPGQGSTFTVRLHSTCEVRG